MTCLVLDNVMAKWYSLI